MLSVRNLMAASLLPLGVISSVSAATVSTISDNFSTDLSKWTYRVVSDTGSATNSATISSGSLLSEIVTSNTGAYEETQIATTDSVDATLTGKIYMGCTFTIPTTSLAKGYPVIGLTPNNSGSKNNSFELAIASEGGMDYLWLRWYSNTGVENSTRLGNDGLKLDINKGDSYALLMVLDTAVNSISLTLENLGGADINNNMTGVQSTVTATATYTSALVEASSYYGDIRNQAKSSSGSTVMSQIVVDNFNMATAVPEPAAVALLACGSLMVLGRRRSC